MLVFPDKDIHQVARINRRVLLLEPEDYRQYTEVNPLLALIR
jgi:hypothetical protein